MGQYTTKGLYNGYKKNNSERECLDYYATPPEEVTNILTIMGLPLKDAAVLEPCCGGGHMINGILDYEKDCKLVGTDYMDRGFANEGITLKYGLDFLADDYPEESTDYIIMNPPFSTIEGFTIRALEIAEKGVLMLGRTQFAESQSRYENIFASNPPSAIYQYVDRVQCWKDGKKPTGSSAQAYAWFYWDKTKPYAGTSYHWIRRANS